MKNIRDFFKPVRPNENTDSNLTEPASVSPGPSNVGFNVSDNVSPSDGTLNESSNVTVVDPGLMEYQDKVKDKNKVPDFDLGSKDSGPKQPLLEKYPSSFFSTQKRCFNTKYFKKFWWLEYSVKRDKVFCFTCRNFASEAELEGKDYPLAGKGFNNWKKLPEKLLKHSLSSLHNASSEKYLAYQETCKSGSVRAKIDTKAQEEVLRNKQYFNKVCMLIHFLGAQGLALRGHDESEFSLNKGNFRELCELFAIYDKDFAKIYNSNHALCGSATQNLIIQISSELMSDFIVSEIKDCGMFAILCDEGRSFKQEQLSLCVRYVKGFKIYERFLLFMNCSGDRSADALSKIILTALNNLGLKNVPIVAQSYDGASVMAGEKGGLQAKIKQFHPQAYFTHCIAHRVALVITDTCKDVDMVRNFFNTIEALYVHFSKPSTHQKFMDLQKSLGIKKFEISQLSDTRWVCRYKNCYSVLNNFETVLMYLREEVDKDSDRNSIEAKGILKSLTSPHFIVCLYVMTEILELLNVLNIYYQKKEATIGGSSDLIEGTIISFEKKRSDDMFNNLWERIEELANKNEISLESTSISKKRRRQESSLLKQSFVDSSIGAREDPLENSTEAKEFWKIKVYFRCLDKVVNCLKTRFSESTMLMAKSIDSFLKLDFINSHLFIENYKNVFDTDIKLLEAEMLIAKNYMDKTIPEWSLDNILPIIDQLKHPNLFKLIQVALIIPVSSATCERSISAMRRIRNYQRETMLQDRFSNMSLMYIEKDVLKNSVTPEQIMDKYLKSGDKEKKLKLTL